jgi:uncharacterized protein YbjQ (UPF0145 family)
MKTVKYTFGNIIAVGGALADMVAAASDIICGKRAAIEDALVKEKKYTLPKVKKDAIWN